MARLPIAALLAAAFFLFAGAERAFSYAACPHHGLPAPAETAHAGHADDSAPADHAGPCTCLGQCQAGSAAAPTSTNASGVLAQGEFVSLTLQTADAPRPRLAPHTLPFATAPPLIVEQA